MQKIAKEYKNYGLSCVPVKLDKSPAVATWKDGVKDLKLFEGAEGIGIICGKMSGGLECLDFDNHFGDARENLISFAAEIQDLTDKYKFPIQSTQSGGFHLLYRCDEIGGNSKLASKPKYEESTKRWRPDAIIETRGEGGYFLAYPTKGYKVTKNSLFDIPVITKEERKHIHEVASSFNTWFEIKKDVFEEHDKPGDIFNNDLSARQEMESELRSFGWTEIREGYWRRPDKTKGISATLGKAANNIFYCFTANGYPFDLKSGYTPFQVVGLLKYKGDFKQFAKDLAERYNLSKPEKRDYSNKEPKKYEVSELDEILKGAYLNLDIPVEKPPVCMYIFDNIKDTSYRKRLFTLGNFSAITGKSKSKKTFLARMLLSAACIEVPLQNKFQGNLSENKNLVCYIDTEQGKYDSYITAKSILDIGGLGIMNYMAYNLRQFSPIERIQIIEYILEKYGQNIGYMVIDGIVDLAMSLNDEIEASKVSNLLLNWTAIYNCHISVIIHQNKNDNYATGHIGSSIMKKAECIISVEKDNIDRSMSVVRCDMIRGVEDFEEFKIHIENGLPFITEFQNTKNELAF